MIASLSGVLKEKSPHSVVVEVNGVGYEAFIPLTTFYRLPSPDERVHLKIHTHVREDALQLYGFFSEDEKRVFLLLLGVSGVGPRLAMNMLSGLPLARFVEAIQKGDVAALSSIPGIGQKTAARLALELKEKIGALVRTGAVTSEEAGSREEGDAVSALVNLGYKSPLAKEAVRNCLKTMNGENREPMTVEALIRESLKILSKT